MMEKPSIMNVKMTKEFAEQIFVRDGKGNKLSVEWGEPDAEGFYVPTISVDYEDNIVAQLEGLVIETYLLSQPCVQQLQDSIRKGDLEVNDYIQSMISQTEGAIEKLSAGVKTRLLDKHVDTM